METPIPALADADVAAIRAVAEKKFNRVPITNGPELIEHIRALKLLARRSRRVEKRPLAA